MAMSVGNVISNYTYTYNNQMRGTLDKDDNAAWSKEELTNYAKDYSAATGKNLDVDSLFEKYANEDGVIDAAGQEKMYADDALGFIALKKASDAEKEAAASSTTSTTATETAKANFFDTTAQRNQVFDAVNAFTYQYGGKLIAQLDKNDDGMWNKEELTNYAAAYKKATGTELDVDAIMEKYGNEDGYIDPTNQGKIQKADALGLNALKTAYDNAIVARESSIRNTDPYKGYKVDTTISGKAGDADFSMDGLLSTMSPERKMAFSVAINRLNANAGILGSFGMSNSGTGIDIFSMLSSKNSYDMLNVASTGKNSAAVTEAMSGQLMNFTL